MSSNEDNPDSRFGYGIDIGLLFTEDGEIDLLIDETGDIGLVGGDGDADITIKVQNVFQQIKIRLLTPTGSLLDERGNSINIGSELGDMIGKKFVEFNAMILKSYIIAALSDMEVIESIFDIKLIVDRLDKPSYVKCQIYFKLQDDDKIYYTTVDILNIGSS